jgi:hypothetical protein
MSKPTARPLRNPSSPTPIVNTRRAGRDLCRGGCGQLMPSGQKCVECATAAVNAWLTTVVARIGRSRNERMP